MFPAALEGYFRPGTVDEALNLLKEHGDDDTHFIAGGQSIMQAIKSRLLTPSNLIDLQAISALSGIESVGERIRIGAMTRYRELAETDKLPGACLALKDAAGHVGDRQVRNRGTIGGSLCWNYLTACIPPTCMGLGASVELKNVDGSSRTITVEDFLGAPLETTRSDHELMIAVQFEAATAGTGSAYKKWGLVTDSLPVVNICVSITVDADGACRDARVVLGALSTGPRRISSAETALVGLKSADTAGIDHVLAVAADEAEFESELVADADYKIVLLNKIGREVIASAFARARGETK